MPLTTTSTLTIGILSVLLERQRIAKSLFHYMMTAIQRDMVLNQKQTWHYAASWLFIRVEIRKQLTGFLEKALSVGINGLNVPITVVIPSKKPSNPVKEYFIPRKK